MSEVETLEPPQTLTPPEPVREVTHEQAIAMVPVTDEEKQALNKRVEEFINLVLNSDVQSDEFKAQVESIHTMGNAEIKQAASMSNRFLDRPVNSMGENGIFGDRSPVAASLINLRETVEGLDPSKKGDLLSPRMLLGFIPLGNKLTGYFRQYQSAQTHIQQILQSLYNGQDELRKDNAAVEIEKTKLWETMGRMEQYVYLGKQIDNELEARLAEIEGQHPEKARVVREEMLFYVRQKNQDILTQLAVAIQGYLALDMVRKNNLELIKGVDRATTTTVSALRTAVMVAQALNNQKLVLDQVTAMNKTTSDLIEGTARQLRQQSSDIHAQASSAMVDIGALERAFEDIYVSMDEMANYKIKALDNMKQSVDTLTTAVDKAKTYVDKVRAEETKSIGERSQDLLSIGEN
ncbi:MAG: toxic anion resistance protein [Candidatus Thiodiazotropha taylori]